MTIEQIQQRFETYTKEYYNLQAEKKPNSLYEPVNYIMQQTGKRIRPLLCLLAFELYRDDISSAFAAANSIELFHNFSLVHDDVMDDAYLRRGKQSVYAKFGLNSSILSGDVMLVHCYQLLAPYIVNKPEVLQIFSKTAIEVCEGQQFDMDFERMDNVSIDDYLNMIRLKTSVLLGASLKIGAILGGADKKDAQLLYDFGQNIGIAFQLMDDWLDAFADPKMFGKAVGGDIANNKKTFLLLKSIELANTEQKAKIQTLIEQEATPEKIQAMMDLYKALNVEEINKKLMQSYHQKALDNLAEVAVSDDKKKHLLFVAEMLFSRIK